MGKLTINGQPAVDERTPWWGWALTAPTSLMGFALAVGIPVVFTLGFVVVVVGSVVGMLT